MTDLSVTAANVVAGTNAKKTPGTSGETVAAGKTVYRDPTSKKFLLADSDSATAAVRDVYGIALNTASLDQPLVVQTEGDIKVGATLVVGKIYVLSDTPGGIMPADDLEQGDYTTVIGVASSASNLKMKIVAGGAPVPAP